MHCLEIVFDDKRISASILVVWMVIAVTSLHLSIDLFASQFMSFGPGPNMIFMTVNIDTWHKWGLLAGATFVNTGITEFMEDAISPWVQNTIQDHKTKYLPYSKFTCYLVSQVWSIYVAITGIFSVALMMSQIDLLIIRMTANLIVNTFTCYKFMKNKTIDRHKYWMWTEDRLQEIHVRNPILSMQEEHPQLNT